MASAPQDDKDESARPALPAPARRRRGAAGGPELETRILHLRLQMRESCEQLAHKMDAALMQILDRAQALEPASKRNAFLRRAARRIDELEIRPHKGRLRDVRRIDALLTELGNDLGTLKQ